MAVTTYAGWVADGRPATPAQPIADMVAMFRAAGFTCGYAPDERHLRARPPEDHTPFSHTPWPGSQPYPRILALDLMPRVEGDGKSLAPIAHRIIADKRAGRMAWVKYLNWTDEQGHVYHTKWQPDEVTTTSSDSGHLHISMRTDYATSHAADGWNPFVATTPGENAMDMNTPVPGTNPPDGSGVRSLAQVLSDLHKALAPGQYRGWQTDNLTASVVGRDAATAGRDAAVAAAAGVKALLSRPGADVDETALAVAIADRLIASDVNGLPASDHAAIVEDVKAALRAGVG
jgi:hypothetical protein